METTLSYRDHTARIHRTAARLGYACAVRDLHKLFKLPKSVALSPRELDLIREQSRAAQDAASVVSARTQMSIWSDAYEAGVSAATKDMADGAASVSCWRGTWGRMSRGDRLPSGELVLETTHSRGWVSVTYVDDNGAICTVDRRWDEKAGY